MYAQKYFFAITTYTPISLPGFTRPYIKDEKVRTEILLNQACYQNNNSLTVKQVLRICSAITTLAPILTLLFGYLDTYTSAMPTNEGF